MKTLKTFLIIFFAGIILSGCKEKKEIEIVPDLESIYLPSNQVDVPIKEGKDFKSMEEKDIVAAVKSLNTNTLKDSLLYNIVLRLYVNENGSIDKIKDMGSVIVKETSSGSTQNSSIGDKNKLDKVLASYMNDWLYTPAINNGKNVKGMLEYTRGVLLKPNGNYKFWAFNYPQNMNQFEAIDSMPRVINAIPPHYPELAKRAGIEGTVYTKVLVSTEGIPTKAVVIKSDNEILNQPAIDAVMQFKFKPALLHNQPVAVWVVIPFRYRLDGSKGELMHYKDLKNAAEKVNGNEIK